MILAIMEARATFVRSSYDCLQAIRHQTQLDGQCDSKYLSKSVRICKRRSRLAKSISIECFFSCVIYTNILFTELERDADNGLNVSSLKNNRTSFLSDYLFKYSAHSRHKRQADQYEYTPTKTRCPLLLVADYRFFQEMGSGNTKTTINYLVSWKCRLTALWCEFIKIK